jgi:hypothetical protein
MNNLDKALADFETKNPEFAALSAETKDKLKLIITIYAFAAIKKPRCAKEVEKYFIERINDYV